MIMMMKTMIQLLSDVLARCRDVLEAPLSVAVDKLMGTITMSMRWMNSRRDDERVVPYVARAVAVVVVAVVSVGKNVADLQA